MICTELWNGSGLGNQLHSYVMCRVLSLDKQTDFGIMGKEKFKGSSFMKLDFGKELVGGITSIEGNPPKELPEGIHHYFLDPKAINEDNHDVRDYNWEGILSIKDNTKIEGYWQGEKYYDHHLDEIREWLKVDKLDMPNDLCVIGFRGGEYAGVPDLFLPQEYWDLAINKMLDINPKMKFEVHTDDVDLAQKFFPNFTCINGIGYNWRSVRYAKYIIMANSSFFILPSLLNQDVKKIIAPQWWAGYNKGYWHQKQMQFSKFDYIHHDN